MQRTDLSLLAIAALLVASAIVACGESSGCTGLDVGSVWGAGSADESSPGPPSERNGGCAYGLADTDDGCKAFESVSAAPSYACGIVEGGALRCWGADPSGVSEPPSGTYRAVSTSRTFGCAIRERGGLECWGQWTDEMALPESGPYRDLDLAQRRCSRERGECTPYRGCAVSEEGAVDCWGFGDSPPVDGGDVAAIAVSARSACVRSTDGTVRCEGSDDIELPEDGYEAISLAPRHLCGLRDGGGVVCRGRGPAAELEPPDGTFRALGAARHLNCGLDEEGSLDCWGVVLDVPEGNYEQLSVGGRYNCAVRADGAVRCWGSAVTGATDPPDGSFQAVATGPGFGCAIGDDGARTCWGERTPSVDEEAAFRQLSASGGGICGIREDGGISCMGLFGGVPELRDFLDGRTIADVDVGLGHVCAVDTGGAADCEGSSLTGATDPPDAAFSSVVAGGQYSCGLRDDERVACWGAIEEPPDGAFAALTGGRNHACGRRTDGRVECWGANDSGQCDPPSESFRDVDAGRNHTCGVTEDGAVLCWGNDEHGEASPPDETFRAVSAGERQTCGIRPDGTLACWGGEPVFAAPSDEWPDAKRRCRNRIFRELIFAPFDADGKRIGSLAGPGTETWRRLGPVPTVPAGMALLDPDRRAFSDPAVVRTPNAVLVGHSRLEPDADSDEDLRRTIRTAVRMRVRNQVKARKPGDRNAEWSPPPAVVWARPKTRARRVFRDIDIVEEVAAETALSEGSGTGVLLAVEDGGADPPDRPDDLPSWVSERLERIRDLRWEASGENPADAEWTTLLDETFSRAVGGCDVAEQAGADWFVSRHSRFADPQSASTRTSARPLAACGCDKLDLPALRALIDYRSGRRHRPLSALRTGRWSDIGAHDKSADDRPRELEVPTDTTLADLVDRLDAVGFRGERPVEITFVDE